jgi:hypothetical protein
VEAEVWLERKFGDSASDSDEARAMQKMFKFWGRQKRHSTDTEKFTHPYDFQMPEMPVHAPMQDIPEEED